MYSCPACGLEACAGRSRCLCGADLSLLQALDAVADAWFNRALKALAEGSPGRALEWLSACCAARFSDAAARRAQARVWAQLHCWTEADDSLERARKLEPDARELKEIEEALREAMDSSSRGPFPDTHSTDSDGYQTLCLKRAHLKEDR